MTDTIALFRCVDTDTLFRVRSEGYDVYVDQYDGSSYSMLYQINIKGNIHRSERAIKEAKRIVEKHIEVEDGVFRLEEVNRYLSVEESFEKVDLDR